MLQRMKKRLLAVVMAMCLAAGSMGMEVLADNAEPETSAEVSKEESQEEAEAAAVEEESRKRMEAPAGPQAGTLNFVYLEEANVALPGEQKVLISVGADGSKVTGAELYYHKAETGEVLQTAVEASSDNALLFSMSYTEEAQTGAYVLDKVVYTDQQGNSFSVDLAAGKEIIYGVNQTVESNPDALVLDEEIEMNVATFDEEGNQKSELSISDALNNVESSKIRTYAAVDAAGASGMTIVLDPGHGGSDPGAVRTHNGVTYYERDIVLKIAEFCKAELETYGGVEVYMTRTDNTSALMDRRQRTDFAIAKGADVVISFHINATGEQETSASGSLVYCPYNNTASGIVSQELANKILEKLEALGLKNRGIMVDEELGMIRYPKENGLPGILIEHAFVNNASDVLNYLSSDEQLKKLGTADASAIAEYYGLRKDEQEYEPCSGAIRILTNAAEGKNTVVVSKISKAHAVRFAVWKDSSDGSDIKWYDTKRNSSGNWTGSFLGSSCRTTGKYNIHAYIINSDGTSVFAAGTTMTVKGPSAESITVQSSNPAKGTFKVVVAGVKSDVLVKKVQVRVYSKADKSDLQVYTASLQADGTYQTRANIKYHDYNYGIYKIEVNVTDNNDITKRVGSATKTFKRPSAKASVSANAAQTKYTISAENIPGISSISAAVWSNNGGQNDLKWYTLKKNSSGKWKVTVPVSNHKTAGTYQVHLYGKTMSGQMVFLENADFRVAGPSIRKVFTSKIDPKAGTFYVYVKATARSGISKVRVKAWSKAGERDSHIYTAQKTGEGTYRVKINVKNHDRNYGTYNLKAYVTDNTGIVVSKSIKQKFVK